MFQVGTEVKFDVGGKRRWKVTAVHVESELRVYYDVECLSEPYVGLTHEDVPHVQLIREWRV